ncbi:PIG-L family deacetylase [Thiocapsa marina]|uniref:LmbE family protein n=1 Tax=Thiocapsa marina 5811 TaxID=768671 RepID=F9U9D0_9GAMM|nr:PIG-L family deacetylase [Thiocapsa marina]EGV19388.1 LmbE family protein [Thiocapsa marina 5811]
MSFVEQHFVPYRAEQSLGPGRALVFAPHPDDEVLGCGGAIMRHVAAGDPLAVVIVTDGGAASGAGSEYARVREQESRCAAEILGYGEPLCWRMPDRGIAYGEALIERMMDAIREQQADLVYVPSWWEMHPDHYAVALAGAEAVRRSEGDIALVMYEVGVPLHPNRLLDITDLVQRKQAAVDCFASQLAQQDYGRHIGALNVYRTYTLPATVLAAEAYRIVRGDALRLDPSLAVRPGVYYTQRQAEAVAPPLVSAILLGADRAHGREALDSVFHQTYPNLEVVALAERTDAARSLPQPPEGGARFPVRWVECDPSTPRGATANTGMAQATGTYLLILDEATLLDPDHVASLMTWLCLDGQAHLARSGAILEEFLDGRLMRRVELSGDPDPARIDSGQVYPLASLLFERALFLDGCRFDDAASDDTDFLKGILASADPLPVDRKSVRRRHRLSPGVPYAQPQRGSSDPLGEDRDPASRVDARIQALEHEVEALRRSSSWRVTAPMRAFSRLLRRL